MTRFDSNLIERAKLASKNAYAPYSLFRVGAAIRSKLGRIFSGCNVENAAYPQGTCAEAGAIASMVLEGELYISEIVIYVETKKFITPCGGCRQKISEFSDKNTQITLVNMDLKKKFFFIEELLPGAFASNDMNS